LTVPIHTVLQVQEVGELPTADFSSDGKIYRCRVVARSEGRESLLSLVSLAPLVVRVHVRNMERVSNTERNRRKVEKRLKGGNLSMCLDKTGAATFFKKGQEVMFRKSRDQPEVSSLLAGGVGDQEQSSPEETETESEEPRDSSPQETESEEPRDSSPQETDSEELFPQYSSPQETETDIKELRDTYLKDTKTDGEKLISLSLSLQKTETDGEGLIPLELSLQEEDSDGPRNSSLKETLTDSERLIPLNWSLHETTGMDLRTHLHRRRTVRDSGLFWTRH
jgi:hypothetical protein